MNGGVLRLHGSRETIDRTSTFALSLPDSVLTKLIASSGGVLNEEDAPRSLELHCASKQVYCTHGNHYAAEMIDELAPKGVTRLSFLHYSTLDDVQRVIEVVTGFFHEHKLL